VTWEQSKEGLGKTFYKKLSGPIPMIMNLGIAGYAQFKITGDSGSDIPPALRGLKDRVFALGPEFNVFIPGAATIVARTIRARIWRPQKKRTQGQT